MKTRHMGTGVGPALLFAAALAAAVLSIAFVSLRLWAYDLRVPLNYSEADVVVILMYIKGLVQDGWPTTLTHLSAPFFYPGAAFPMLTSTDWSIMKVLSIFTHEPGYLLNLFWLLTVVFSAWSAAYAGWQLGLSRTLAFAGGVVYAFLPYALLRYTHHLSLVYYLVPLLCLLAIVIAGGGAGIRNSRQAIVVGLLACALQGFNYIYYSFFAALLFGVAALIAWKPGHTRLLKLPALAIAIISLATAINLIPALQTWKNNGTPPEMGYKSIAEAEIYGAKLRRMLAPHPANPIHPLALFAQMDESAGFPNENENRTARLGLYAAFGLLLMLFYLLRQHRRADLPQPMGAVSSLGLATLLVITVGGFGAMINVLTTPDIRAYNRFSVYLAFFGVAFSGLWLKHRFGMMQVRWRTVGYIVAGLFLMLSLYDQLLDTRPLRGKQQQDMHRANEERTAVEKLERTLPDGSAVLQLPFTGYPPISTLHQMTSYDHGRAYIWSNHLKWSWPSFSQRHRMWQNKMQTLHGADLLKAAVLSGFDAIWIDRAAYQDDGNELLASLTINHARQVDIDSKRFAVIDLREVRTKLKASIGEAGFSREASALLRSEPAVEWKKGFYEEERNAEGRRYRWAQNNARLDLRNFDDEVRHACIGFGLGTPTQGMVRIEGAGQPMEIKVSSTPRPVRIPLSLKAGETISLRFSTDLPRVNAEKDPRNLYFFVMDFDLPTDEGGNTPVSCSKG